MSDAEWDDIMRVHLRGHFLPTRAATRYWRAQAKAARPVQAAIVNTTSTSGLFNNPGQANYGAAKTGITSLTIIADKDLGRYGVRVNAIAPAARTRLTLANPNASAATLTVPADGFDPMAAANISPFVAYLATADCPIRGRVFFVKGGGMHLFRPFAVVDAITKDGRWTIEDCSSPRPGSRHSTSTCASPTSQLRRRSRTTLCRTTRRWIPEQAQDAGRGPSPA
jgi:NAD(P)-dependent dehydrogenase (short-subunit alcohol dehydrogenase family)